MKRLPTVAIKFSKVLKQTRLKQGLTQEEAAELVGMDIRYYQRLESKRPYIIRIDTLTKIAKALKVSPSKLLGF